MINTNPLPIWKKKRGAVSPSSSFDYTLSLSKFTALRFVFSVYNKTEERFFSCNYSVFKTQDGIVDTLTDKKNKSKLDLEVIGTESATDFILSIVNNESFSLDVDYALLTL